MNKIFKYTFEEFAQHFRAMMIVRNYTQVRLDYEIDHEPIEIGTARDFEAQAFRILDYMSQIYKDIEERIYKGTRLLMAMKYLAFHMKEFEKAGLAYLEEDSNKPSYVSHELVQAIHKVFCCPKPHKNPLVENIINTAKTYSQDHSKIPERKINMQKKMEEVIVKTLPKEGIIELHQPNIQDENLGTIWITPDQVDVLVKWLKEAKQEFKKMA